MLYINLSNLAILITMAALEVLGDEGMKVNPA